MGYFDGKLTVRAEPSPESPQGSSEEQPESSAFANPKTLQVELIGIRNVLHIELDDGFWLRITPVYLRWQSDRIERAFEQYARADAAGKPWILAQIEEAIEFHHRCLDFSGLELAVKTPANWKPQSRLEIPFEEPPKKKSVAEKTYSQSPWPRPFGPGEVACTITAVQMSWGEVRAGSMVTIESIFLDGRGAWAANVTSDGKCFISTIPADRLAGI